VTHPRLRKAVIPALGALAVLAACFWHGFYKSDEYSSTKLLLLLSLPIPFATGLAMLLLILVSEDRFDAVVEERRAAALSMGLVAADALPEAMAGARVFKRGRSVLPGRPLRGSWTGGDVFIIDHSYLGPLLGGGFDDDDDRSARRYALVFAFQVPANAGGVAPPKPWKVEGLEGWVVLSRTQRERPIETARLPALFAEATALARETLV